MVVTYECIAAGGTWLLRDHTVVLHIKCFSSGNADTAKQEKQGTVYGLLF